MNNHKGEFKINLFPAQTIMFLLSLVGCWYSNFEGFKLLADSTPDRLHSHAKFTNKPADSSLNGFFTFISSFGFGTRMTLP